MTGQTTVEFYNNQYEKGLYKSQGEIFVSMYDFGWKENFKMFFNVNDTKWVYPQVLVTSYIYHTNAKRFKPMVDNTDPFTNASQRQRKGLWKESGVQTVTSITATAILWCSIRICWFGRWDQGCIEMSMYLYRKSSLLLFLDYCKLTIPLNVYNYTLQYWGIVFTVGLMMWIVWSHWTLLWNMQCGYATRACIAVCNVCLSVVPFVSQQLVLEKVQNIIWETQPIILIVSYGALTSQSSVHNIPAYYKE